MFSIDLEEEFHALFIRVAVGIENYRGIVKLNSIPKLLEQLVTRRLAQQFRSIISESHRFLRNKSTDTNLLEFSIYVSESLSQGIQTDVIYADFSKGSNLGPILFALYLNDLPSIIRSSNKLMHEDDIKLYSYIRSPSDSIGIKMILTG